MSDGPNSKNLVIDSAVVGAPDVPRSQTASGIERLLLRAAAEGVYALDSEGRLTFLNPAAAAMLRVPPNEAIGRSIHDLTHYNPRRPDPFAPGECPICRSYAGPYGRRMIHEVFWRPDGTSFPVEYSVSALRDDDTDLSAMVVFSDITARRINSQEMLHVLASAQCLLWYADVQFVSHDKPLRWFLWPPDPVAAQSFLPIEIGEGQSFAEAFYVSRLDEDKLRTDAYGREQILAGSSRYQHEYRCRRIDGEVRWLSETVHVEPTSEGRWRAVGVCTDITDLKQREHEIAVLNERLQRAMTETHHRVKNNLQVIAAMIDLQTADQPETLPLGAFQRLSQQVRTLASVHDILTQETKSAAQAEYVSARTVLEKLLEMMQQTAGGAHLRYALDDARLSSRQVTSLALVANELVSNAVKHGRASVDVRFSVVRGAATLEVSDDGPGFPPDFDASESASTGLELVQNLTRWDLRGEARFENRPEGGANATVSFPLVDG